MAGTHTGCRCMTNRTGALIIGWLDVIFVIPLILGGLVAFIMGLTYIPGECPKGVIKATEFYLREQNCLPQEYHQYFTVGGIVTLAVCTLYLFAPCCLLHGVNNKRPSLLIPFIIVGVLKKIVIFVLIIVSAAACPPAAILPILEFLIELWKTIVVCCHYDYLSGLPKDDNEMLLTKGPYVHL